MCTICSAQIAYSKNTSNLRSHLKNKHKDIFEEIDMLLGTKLPGLSEDHQKYKALISKDVKPTEIELSEVHNSFVIDEEHDVQYEVKQIYFEDKTIYQTNEFTIEKEMDEQMVTEDEELPINVLTKVKHEVTSLPMFSKEVFSTQLMKMLITDLLPIDTVKGAGFINFIKTISNEPNSSNIEKTLNSISETIENYFKKLIKKFYALVKQTLKDNNFSLCFEQWTNCEKKNFFTISVNVLHTANYELQNIILDVVETNLNWENWFKKHDYLKVQEKCVAVVVNHEDTNLLYYFAKKAPRIPIVPCLASSLEKAVEQFLLLDTVSHNVKTILDEYKHLVSDQSISESWLSKFSRMTELKEKIDCNSVVLEPALGIIITNFVDCVNPVKVSFNYNSTKNNY